MLKRFFSEFGVKILLWAGSPIALVFSIFWSVQDQALNLWPLAFLYGFMAFFFLMFYIFRNNP